MYRKSVVLVFGFALLVSPVWAQELTTETIECLPNEANLVITASVEPEVQASDEVRLYFRRLNPTGAYYWVAMNAAPGGSYWTPFPKPETREQRDLTDDWWELLQNRDWMEDRDRDWLEDWLENQDHEAAEYFVVVVDTSGEETARTETMLVPVRDRDDCRVGLDPFEAGQADNLTIGETTEAQFGREVYHWLCDGIVTRESFEGILRGDDICRACVVATWLPVVPAGAALIAGTTIEKREPKRVSEVQPNN